MMNKDELEEYIYDNIGTAVNISDDMFMEFKKNGRLDIVTTVEEKVTVEQQSSSNTNPFEKEEGNKEKYTGSKIQRNEFSIFGEENNLMGYEMLAPYLEKEFVIKEAIIRRGQSAYHFSYKLTSLSNASAQVKCIGSIEINLLFEITCNIRHNCTGMDNRRVVRYISQNKNDDEIWIMAEFDLKDDNGPVIGKYKLSTIKKIESEIQIF